MPEMQRIKTRVCWVGEAAVGKTSLIRRFVQDETADERGLADRGLADQAHLRLDALHLGHGGRVSILPGLLKTSGTKVERKEPFSPRVSCGLQCAWDTGSSSPWT